MGIAHISEEKMTRNRMKKLVKSSMLALVALITVIGCLGGGEASPVQKESKVSECGGFAATGNPLPTANSAVADYCAAERLHWSYDRSTETLSLADTRVPLNCCGDRGVSLEKSGEVYVMTETDNPKDGSGRCNCLCVFDFATKGGGVPAGVIRIRIQRRVSDSSNGSEKVYEGELDLAKSAGTEVINNETTPWCRQ